MPTKMPKFEADYLEDGFSEKDLIQFEFRGVVYSCQRMTMAERSEFLQEITSTDAVLSEGDFLEMVLEPSEWKQFETAANDKEIKVMPSTLKKIVDYIQQQMSGGEDPKRQGSSGTSKRSRKR